MRSCPCGNPIPWRITVDGVRRLLANRKSCLECFPFIPKGGKGLQEQRARNLKAYRKTESGKQARFLRTLRNYGITLEQYEVMKAGQGGLCKICRFPSRKKLNIDHDHATGRVRGLLCAGCNIGLGAFRDSVGSMKSAIEYLSAST